MSETIPMDNSGQAVVYVQNTATNNEGSFIRSRKCWNMCICIFVVIGTIVGVATSFRSFGFSSFFSDSRSWSCQGNNDTGVIFMCEFSKDCIDSVFSYREIKNKTPTGRNITRNLLCDGSCDCKLSRCEDENEACPNLGCNGREKGMHQCDNGASVGTDYAIIGMTVVIIVMKAVVGLSLVMKDVIFLSILGVMEELIAEEVGMKEIVNECRFSF